MTKQEAVDILREKTGASFDEAFAALEDSSWDVFDAANALGNSHVSSNKVDEASQKNRSKVSVDDVIAKITGVIRTIGNLLIKCEHIRICVSRNDEEITSFALSVTLLILILKWWLPPLLVALGLFAGYRFKITNGGMAGKILNSAAAKAEEGAKTIKDKVIK